MFQETAEGSAGKVVMIASSSAPARAHALVSVPLSGRDGNLTKPTSPRLCYLFSRAENVFLFFPKKKLLLNLREMELCTPGKTFEGNKNQLAQ